MSTLSIEERLGHARGIAAVLSRLAEQASLTPDDAPPKAFWRGVSDMADAIEQDLAALQQALEADVTNRDAPDVFVEK